MIVLQIEHPVPNFAGWKQAFDSDPVDRKGSRVRRYRIMRPVDNQLYSMIELEFDTVADAEAMLGKLRELWSRVEGTIMNNPQVRIVEIVEAAAY